MNLSSTNEKILVMREDTARRKKNKNTPKELDAESLGHSTDHNNESGHHESIDTNPLFVSAKKSIG